MLVRALFDRHLPKAKSDAVVLVGLIGKPNYTDAACKTHHSSKFIVLSQKKGTG